MFMVRFSNGDRVRRAEPGSTRVERETKDPGGPTTGDFTATGSLQPTGSPGGRGSAFLLIEPNAETVAALAGGSFSSARHLSPVT
jgi:hypothetical protein